MTNIIYDRIEEPTQSYLRMSDGWDLPRTLMGGTREMRKAGRKYLPQWPKEDDESYRIRLHQSFLFNAFRKTIQGMVGRVFSKPVHFSGDVPEEIVAMAENIDLTGRHINSFARDVFEDGITYGLSHILVEMPSQRAQTLAEERAMNIRPYWVHVKAEELIGWRATMVDGYYMLTQVRIKEQYLAEAGQYGERIVDRVRILYPGRYEIWDAVNSNEYAMVESGETSLPYIPLVTFYAAREGHMLARPPLQDLADKNLEHWQSASDQRHILHVARVPLLFGAGLPDDFGTANIGPNVLISAPDGADLKFVEHSGASIGAGERDLEKIERQMEALAMQAMLDKPGTRTATERTIDEATSISELQAMAFNLQDALEQAMMITADYMGMGEDAGGQVVVNRDVGISARDVADLQILQQARVSGDISREVFWAELMRRGVLSDDFDPETEAIRVEALPEPMDLGTPPALDQGISIT